MDSIHYSIVPTKNTSEILEDDEKVNPNFPKPKSYYLAAVSITIALILAIITITVLSAPHTICKARSKVLQNNFNSANEALYNNCGSSPDEARSRGCSFDILMGVWELPECFDAELQEEYLHYRNWKWFEDANMTREMPMEILSRGDHTVAYATNEFHLIHCMYVWIKQHKAFLAGGSLDQDSLNVHHTKHCAHYAFDGPEPLTPVRNGYPNCTRIPTHQ